jgi:hypothetical protein
LAVEECLFAYELGRGIRLEIGAGELDLERVPPPVTAPSTTSSGTTGQDPSVIDETNDPDGTKAAAKTVPAGPE